MIINETTRTDGPFSKSVLAIVNALGHSYSSLYVQQFVVQTKKKNVAGHEVTDSKQINMGKVQLLAAV